LARVLALLSPDQLSLAVRRLSPPTAKASVRLAGSPTAAALDTLKELFEGNQKLFVGLYAEKHWDWSVKYPVIRLSFGPGVHKRLASLEAAIHEQLEWYETAWNITEHLPDIPIRNIVGFDVQLDAL
jgi:hypothetical protein